MGEAVRRMVGCGAVVVTGGGVTTGCGSLWTGTMLAGAEVAAGMPGGFVDAISRFGLVTIATIVIATAASAAIARATRHDRGTLRLSLATGPAVVVAPNISP